MTTTNETWAAVRSSVEERLETATNPQHIDALSGVLEHTTGGVTEQEQTASGSGLVRDGRIRGRRLSEVAPLDVPWMWPGHIALGSIVIWYGRPGCGKSSAALEYVARVTQGWDNPDGSKNDYPGSVVLACFEDSLEYTVVERLRIAGADLSKISDLSMVEKQDIQRGGTIEQRFSLATDLPELAAEVTAMKASLVVLDPMLSMFGSISNFNNQRVGSCLDDLKRWAEEQGVAVLLVAHATKDGTTLAGGAQTERAARQIFHFAPDGSKKGLVIVSNTKNNLAPTQPNMAFRKKADDTIEWVHGEEPGLQKKHDAQRYGALRLAMQARIDGLPQTLFTIHSFMDIENYNFATVNTHLQNMRNDGTIKSPVRGKFASLMYIAPVVESTIVTEKAQQANKGENSDRSANSADLHDHLHSGSASGVGDKDDMCSNSAPLRATIADDKTVALNGHQDMSQQKTEKIA